MNAMRIVAVVMGLMMLAANASAQAVVYEGTSGLGVGKQIVFFAGDHEYRSEETLPQLARILAKHHGCKCSVLFNVDKSTGENRDELVWARAAGSLHNSVGPHVDDSVKKYKRDAKAMLLEILEPSRNIEEKYRQVILELQNGTARTGIIITEDATSLTILTGTPVKEQKIPKKSIDARSTSTVSIMPNNLLNTLDKEQILDLLAYLLASGNANDAAFTHHH